MRSFWFDPYLWIHLAGLAAAPIFLEICLLGLAVGDPVLPLDLEFLIVAIVGIAPILWMQWQRPFYIFSLVVLALKPSQLTESQRRLLTCFKSGANRAVAVVTALSLGWVLWQLYWFAPMVTAKAPALLGGRLGGLAVAAIGFLLCNLFVQVPLSVLRVLWVNEAQFAATQPYPLEAIAANFTLVGLQVKQIVPSIDQNQPASPPAVSMPNQKSPSVQPPRSTATPINSRGVPTDSSMVIEELDELEDLFD
jgi:hypothetical protein